MAFRNKFSSGGGSVSLGPRRYDPDHPSLIDGLVGEDMQRAAADWKPSTPPSLAGHTDIRLDFECTGLKWWESDVPVGVAYYLPATEEGGYLPWAHEGGGNLGREQVIDWLVHEVRGKHIVNSKTNFDVHMARVGGVDLVAQGNTFSDVAFYAALLDDHRVKFSQEALVRDFLEGKVLPPGGVGKIKIALGFDLDPKKFAKYPAGLVALRAIHDVETVDLLHRVMYPQLVKEDLLRVLALENDVLPVVCEMEKNGAPIDVELLDSMIADSEKDLEAALYRIRQASGVSLRTPDNRDDLFRLFAQLRIDVPIDLVKGNKTFADAYLKPLTANPVIQDVRLAKMLASVRSKFLLKYKSTVDSNGILRYALHQLRTDKEGEEGGGKGTVSGRFSSAGLTEDDGVNVQQVPAVGKQKKSLISKYIIRRLFKPGEGQWLAADASQIEYRLFAHYANSKTLIDAYVDNPLTDYHDLVGELIKKVAGKELVREHTKGVNFAQVYGAGIDKMAQQLGVERFVAEELANIYHGMFPEVKPLLGKASHVAKPGCDDRCRDWDAHHRAGLPHRGHVTTYLGRRARFGQTDRHYSALNRVIQGTAADVNKRVLIEAYKERDRLEITMRFTVHDELDADLRNPDKLGAVSEVLNTQYYPFRVPILWKIGTGRNWMEAK